ncbi:MAG: helix-turn-helix domain-containing protein [Gallionellaceae bacterium]
MSPRNFSNSDISGLGESQVLEFKRSGRLIKEAFTDLCAMVNANVGTGTVVFGIEPNGVACGLQVTNLDTFQQTLAQHAQQKLDPPLQIEMEPANCDEKPILFFRATRNRGVSFHEYDGRAYIREGSATRQLTLSEKRQLELSRNRDLHNGPWRCDRCGGVAASINGIAYTDSGPQKIYIHQKCGGEWWPAT